MADAGIAIPTTTQRTFKIKCFEHVENTPSLVVSVQKGLFNCFGSGCSIGGDIIAFTQQYYRMDFIQAVNYLINQYSLDVSDLIVEKTKEEKDRDRYHNINELAAKFLHDNLSKTPQILAFFKERGISNKVCQESLIGYSQTAAHIPSYLRSKGISQTDIETLQFTREDIFANRIIYPMRDSYGNITHFYGRATIKSAVKYIGMSKSYAEIPHPLIDRAAPFGFHIARTHVSKEAGKLILVEGHNDVLGLHSHGLRNVAAVMGAAPSPKQYSLLHDHHIKNIIMCPDGDEAGFRTITAINENRTTHQHVKIMTIPDGSDPDEYVRDQGEEAFRKLVDDAVYPIELIIKSVAEKYADATPTAKFDLATDAMKYMASLSGFEREFAIDELATITNIDKNAIEEAIAMRDEGPTSDVELERKVVGECINDKAKAMHAISNLSHLDFTNAKLSIMWNAIKAMIDADVEPFTREMFTTFAIDKEFITEQESVLVPNVNIGSMYSLDYAITKLTDLALRRRLIQAATKLLVDSKAKKMDVHDVLNKHMAQIATSTTNKSIISTAQNHITTTMNVIHERMSNPGIPGIDIGHQWKKLMYSLMGFQRGHMLTIAGVTKAGKTTIAQNWNMQQLLNVGEPTLWINLEMNEVDLVMRNLSILSGVDNNKIKVGNISKEEKDAIDKAAIVYHGFKLHVANMAGTNVFDVINAIRNYVYSHSTRIVFIDYMQLIRSDRSRSKSALWEDQNDVVSAIRDAIAKLNITGILISQLNRGAMADGSANGQFVSGTIKLIQDSDCFMGIRKKRKEELEIMPHSNSALQIEYNRHGPQGLEIDLQFKYGSMQIREA